MKTKALFLKIVILSLIFLSLILLGCKSQEEVAPMMVVVDTIQVPDVLSDQKILMEFGYDKIDILDHGFKAFVVPAGTKLQYEVNYEKNKKFITVNKNDFIVIKSDIYFYHPETKRLENLLSEYNVNNLKPLDYYRVYNVTKIMDVREVEELIQFSELTLFEAGTQKNRTYPYLISHLEEWNQMREYDMLKDNDPIFFEREQADKFYKNQSDWNDYFTVYKKPGSYIPSCYIKTKGNGVVAIIGQDGKLWRTREESAKLRKEKN